MGIFSPPEPKIVAPEPVAPTTPTRDQQQAQRPTRPRRGDTQPQQAGTQQRVEERRRRSRGATVLTQNDDSTLGGSRGEKRTLLGG